MIIMKGLLLHVGADTTNLGVVGPVFPDMSFEFLPINNTYGIEKRTYGDFEATNRQYGQTLADFLPSSIAKLPVHFDPDFDQHIYGQDLSPHPRAYTLRKLEKGDMLFFVASLAPYDAVVYEQKDALLKNYQSRKKNKYLIGFFTVKGVSEIHALQSTPRLALALLGIRVFEEEGEKLFDFSDLNEELRLLTVQGVIKKEGDVYRLSRELEVFRGQRSGEEIADWIGDLWPEDEASQRRLLENGQFDMRILSGEVTEEIAKRSHHYRRLRPLDLDHFILIIGDATSSSRLFHAVPLTNGFKEYGYTLNELGRAILKRTSDSVRGARWIDEDSVKLLAGEIAKFNCELTEKFPH